MAFKDWSTKIETKVKVLGWLELVATLLLCTVIISSFTILAVRMTAVDNKELGREVSKLCSAAEKDEKNEINLEISKTTDADKDQIHKNKKMEGMEDEDEDEDQIRKYKNTEGMEGIEDEDEEDRDEYEELTRHLVVWVVSSVKRTEDAEQVGMRFKIRSLELWGSVSILLVLILSLNCLTTTGLLIGAYKKQPSFALPWLWQAIVGFGILIGSVFFIGCKAPDCACRLPLKIHILFFAFCMFRLIKIIVVHRFWRDTNRPLTSDEQPTTKPQGDKPLIISMALPESVFNPKK